jgi:hypothetical protein
VDTSSAEPVNDSGQFWYETALTRVAAQEQDLNEIRQRAATVGTFGVAATGLLGAFVLNKHPHDVLGLIALLVFVLAVIALGFVLFPRKEWKFRLSATTMAAHYRTDAGGPDFGELAVELDNGADENQGKLNDLMGWFGKAVILLGLETALWLVALVVR